MAKPDLGFTHEEDNATPGSNMSASWGLPGAMLAASLSFLPFSLGALRQDEVGCDDRFDRLFYDRIARRET